MFEIGTPVLCNCDCGDGCMFKGREGKVTRTLSENSYNIEVMGLGNAVFRGEHLIEIEATPDYD